MTTKEDNKEKPSWPKAIIWNIFSGRKLQAFYLLLAVGILSYFIGHVKDIIFYIFLMGLYFTYMIGNVISKGLFYKTILSKPAKEKVKIGYDNSRE